MKGCTYSGLEDAFAGDVEVVAVDEGEHGGVGTNICTNEQYIERCSQKDPDLDF
jgi:hypothetical protein